MINLNNNNTMYSINCVKKKNNLLNYFSSIFIDKYAEGFYKSRFYSKCHHIDIMESTGAQMIASILNFDFCYLQNNNIFDSLLLSLFSVYLHINDVEIINIGKCKKLKLMAVNQITKSPITSNLFENLYAIKYLFSTNKENLLNEMIKYAPNCILLGTEFDTTVYDIDFLKRIKVHLPNVVIIYNITNILYYIYNTNDNLNYIFNKNVDIAICSIQQQLHTVSSAIILSNKKYQKLLSKGCPLVIGGPNYSAIFNKIVSFENFIDFNFQNQMDNILFKVDQIQKRVSIEHKKTSDPLVSTSIVLKFSKIFQLEDVKKKLENNEIYADLFSVINDDKFNYISLNLKHLIVLNIPQSKIIDLINQIYSLITEKDFSYSYNIYMDTTVCDDQEENRLKGISCHKNIENLQEEIDKTHLNLIASSSDCKKVINKILTSTFSGETYSFNNKKHNKILFKVSNALKSVFGFKENYQSSILTPSGTYANFLSYSSMIDYMKNKGVNRKLKILSMSLNDGGHLSHGYKINISSVIFEVKHYTLKEDGCICYKTIEDIALEFQPDIIIAGYSAYTKKLNYKKFKEISDKVGAFLLADIAHIAGFIASKIYTKENNPINYADIITTTMQKTLFGFRSGLVIYKNYLESYFKKNEKIMLNDVPLSSLVAKEACLKRNMKNEYKDKMKNVLHISSLIEKTLSKNFKNHLPTTENHMVILDVTPFDITGIQAEKALSNVNILCNKNIILNDKKGPFVTSGIRLGSSLLGFANCSDNVVKRICEIIIETLKNVMKDINEKVVIFKDVSKIRVLKKEIIEISKNLHKNLKKSFK